MTHLALAIGLWRRGEPRAAELACEAALAGSADNGDALLLLAEIYSATGRAEQAAGKLQQLAQLRPADPATHRRLGDAWLASGRPGEAVAAFRRALELEPESIRAHNNLGQALLRLGQVHEALRQYDRALELRPDYAIAHNNRGMGSSALGQYDQAIASYRRAIALNPQFGEAHFNCGNALVRVHDPAGALACYDRAIALMPLQLEARVNRGNVLQELGRFEAALADYDYALERRPDHAVAWTNKANALLELKRAEQALACCDRAIELRADLAEAHNNRAGALRALHRYSDALCANDHALQVDPDNVEGWFKRGTILDSLCEQGAARECYLRVLHLDPRCLKARLRLLSSHIPIIPDSAEQISQSRRALWEELTSLSQWVESTSVQPGEAPAAVGQLFYLTYQEYCNRDFLANYRGLCSRLMSLAYPDVRPIARSVPAARIRVGIVSAHIYDHSVYKALVQGWLRGLDRNRFEIHIFHLSAREDEDTAAARALADRFEGGSRALSDWVELIRASHPDVLIFPEVGMYDMTLRLAALRLAPRQLASWGHPETTGLPTMDHYVSADAFEPPHAQEHYTEQLVRLPHLGVHYEPYGITPATFDLEAYGVPADAPVLVCPGVPFKYGPQHDHVLTDIARRVGHCRFVFFEAAGPGPSQKLRERLSAAFAASHLEASRHLTFIPWQPREAFFGVLERSAVYLDTIGFSGFNSLMQAVECGLPCVTLEGTYLRGRLGSGILREMGLSELVASDSPAYVEIAVRLAQDATYRAAVRAELRARRSALMCNAAPVEGLARLLEECASCP